MHTTQASVDLAKSVFEVAVSDTPGSVQERHRLSRAQFRRFFEDREPRNVRNSRARCREKVWPMTVPDFTSSAAYKDVVPWRG